MRLHQEGRIFTLRNEARFAPLAGEFRSLCNRLRKTLPEGINEPLYGECIEFAHRLFAGSENLRDRTIALAVKQEITVAQCGRWLAANRWLERMAHHVWRVSAHLGGYDIEEDAENKTDVAGG